jgi:hypothetical protein
MVTLFVPRQAVHFVKLAIDRLRQPLHRIHLIVEAGIRSQGVTIIDRPLQNRLGVYRLLLWDPLSQALISPSEYDLR